MSGLFEVAGGGTFRVNEFRRVGFPSYIRESRFRWFGTEASFEEMTTTAYRQDKAGVTDVSEEIEPRKASAQELAGLENISPTLRDAFLSGLARCTTRAGCRRSTSAHPTATRAATTSWPTTSSPR